MSQEEVSVSDAVLVQRVQLLDDREAFATLVKRHQGPLRHYLRRLIGADVALAEDLAQESFLKAYRALSGFRGDSSFRTWLIRVAYRRFLDHREAACVEGGPSDEPQEHLADTRGIGPEMQAAMSLDLDRALQALSHDQRMAVLHCHVAGLTHVDAAHLLGWPVATLQSHLRRALARLRPALQDWAQPPTRRTP